MRRTELSHATFGVFPHFYRSPCKLCSLSGTAFLDDGDSLQWCIATLRNIAMLELHNVTKTYGKHAPAVAEICRCRLTTASSA